MKKSVVVKVTSGAVLAAALIAGAIHVTAAPKAGIPVAAESGSYAARMNDEEWEAASDSLTAAGKAVNQAAKAAAAEKTAAAESAEEAETTQTAPKPKPTTQTTQNTQQSAQPTQDAQSVQAVQDNQPAQNEQSTQPNQSTQSAPSDQTSQSAQTSQNTQPTYPTTYTCGVCGVQFYDQNEAVTHAKTHAEPAPAPQPATKKVPVHVCSCGAYFFTYDELCAHQDSYEFGTGHDSDTGAEIEVPVN